ncbi:GNAT family N-acetyltransferase [Simiduia sp. 21SJ11W-1]|uniref:GNAT family N-acetyltransferase n=1 Tax=Simiduia sp. 21SJ11W-1 TaxID=2909669 RepID=UPI00209EC448|nr:GNAT family N-acetyltransferase [Simiduia sp. 21SJ11W-1]UTA46898.1 GNAT family N-acetyltransferase [Simiduia sp. 21SJ11W-1]
MPMLETERLRLEPLTPVHAPLLQAVFNDADFLRYVGDKGLKTEAECAQYIISTAQSAPAGVVNYAVVLKNTGQWAGICGLLKRPYLDAPDLGYGLLPEARGQGIAREAARTLLAQACAFTRLWAMVNPANRASCRLLQDLGFSEAPAPLPETPFDNLLIMQWNSALEAAHTQPFGHNR